MKRAFAAGVLVFLEHPRPAMLVLHRPDGSSDLPKGHLKRGEDHRSAALRELIEETAIPAACVQLDPTFAFESTYPTRGKGGGRVEKTVRIFGARLPAPHPVRVARGEHRDYSWLPFAAGDPDALGAALAQIADNPTLHGAALAWVVHQRACRELP
jgi:8-oxo-dGTP pyrophosphatase MutT (NUDIX family)